MTGKSKIFKLKTINNKLFIAFICLVCIFLTSCGSESSQYEDASKEAAETALNNEVEDVTWTSVKAGKLEYLYTMYNEDEKQYKTCYFASFDEEGSTEDEWIIIEVYMDEDELSVVDTNCSYLDAAFYEDFDKNPTWTSGSDGLWINVNASETDIKEAKEFYNK